LIDNTQRALPYGSAQFTYSNSGLSGGSAAGHFVQNAYLFVTSLTRSVTLLHQKTLDYQRNNVTGHSLEQ
jgi:hypothetical protein